MEQSLRVEPRVAMRRQLLNAPGPSASERGRTPGRQRSVRASAQAGEGGAIHRNEPRRKRRRGKRSGERSARVTARFGDALPRIRWKQRSAAVQGRDFEGRECVAGMRARVAGASVPEELASGNAANPMAGSMLQHACAATKEKAVEALRKREDGTRTGAGSPVPKEANAASVACSTGSGLRGG